MVREKNYFPGQLQQSREPALRIVLYTGMAALLFLSLYYYKLRTGFSDTPNYIVDMTRNGGFVIAHNRFVSILNQWLPALLLQFGGSLRAIAFTYSFSYTLAPIVMALLAMHWLKQPYTALAILLLFTLMNALLFYYTVSELQMGLGLLLFYNGIIDYCIQAPDRRTRVFAITTLLLLPTVAFSHPMAMPVFVGWLIYRVIKEHRNRGMISMAVVCFGIAYAIKKHYFVSGYEAGREPTWESVRRFGLNYYYGPLGQSFYKYVLQEAFLVPLVLLCTIGVLIYLRKWRMLVFLIGIITLLYTLVMIAFEEFDGSHIYDHYYEHYLQPAILFIVLIFSGVLAVLRLDGRLKAAVVSVILIISLAKINTRSEWHIARQKWEYSYLALMDRLQLKKAIVGRVWIPDGMWKGSFWSGGAETLFLSSLEGPQRAKTLFMAWNIHKLDAPYNAPDEFLMDGGSFKQGTLPQRYFALGNKPYVFLEHVVPDSVLEHMRWP